MEQNKHIDFDSDITTKDLKKVKITAKTNLRSLVVEEKKQVDENKTVKSNDIILDIFKKHYPGKTIKPLQYDIIKSVAIDKVDTLGILPTGYGKSACFQIPFLMNPNKIEIVISPLISLMEDQKDKLEKMNIPVACFHSNLKQKQKQEIKDNILMDLVEDKDNSGMILFFTPEYMVKCQHLIQQLAKKDKLCLVAIDEAHCVSTWGHDFRPDYQGLYRIKEWVPNVPILALTATATGKVELDIKTFLQLTNVNVFKTSFDRPNLLINLHQKPKEFSKIFLILNKHKNDFSIIYCKTRDKAETICEILKTNDYNAGVYHAGLSASNRLKIQEQFSNKKLNIIVATVAFGMGIDQNVHLVVHWGCPADMESYYQEIGRAGRDGIVSDCYMYYDREDFRISRYFLKSIEDVNYRKFKDEQIMLMERYCLLSGCRRKTILEHFGEKLPSSYVCNKCDNCEKKNNISESVINNILYPIFMIIKTIFTIKCKSGVNKICLILRGSKSKLIGNFNNVATYGLLKDLTEEQIKTLLNIIVVNNYLSETTITSGFGTIINTTAKVIPWYSKLNTEFKDKSLSYDSLIPTLVKPENKLNLNIPLEYLNIIKNIKYTSILETMIHEFNFTTGNI